MTLGKGNIEKKEKILGVGLVSGGLDSLIACSLLKQQNIDIVGLNFTSPFCSCNKAYENAECGLNIFEEKLGIKVYHLPKEDDYLELVRNPKFGYGKHLNPCIDCRIYILKKAEIFREKINADFIFTGEVLNQRPKSQHLKALNIVEKESGLEGKLLRPLSALLLAPTIHEKSGLIDRSKLLDIKGKSRKVQLNLAKKHGLLKNYYACGGCLLTDEKFSSRMSDYLKFNKTLKMKDMVFLKYGRHFRYKEAKIIIGRNQIENNILLQIKNLSDIVMEAKGVVGPITLIQGKIEQKVIEYAAKLTLRYSDFNGMKGKVCYSTDKSNLNNCFVVDNELKKNTSDYIL
jgi:tRNA U34 2-thiouridine synthase MnmA/TrmU